MKETVKEVQNALQNKDITTAQVKGFMSDIVGISPESMFNRLKWMILENDKDAGTAFKALSALLKEHGVILSADDDKQNVTVPILNITVDKTTPQLAETVQDDSQKDG